jgi:DeoR/GlpR family transcriptional regulator of sugar metabolism
MLRIGRASTSAPARQRPHASMIIAQRQSRLQELVARRGVADLDTLAAELDVSQSTVRRDIETLERKGLVQRTHGGVVWVGQPLGEDSPRPYAFDQRMGYQQELKRRIAQAARALVQPGETILLDGGTTTFFFAQALRGLGLQVVTNSVPIANLLLGDAQIELVLTGGIAYPRAGVLLGPILDNVLTTIHARTLFFSAAGVYESALYNQNLLLVQAEQRMMQQAQQVVLLADSSKFGQQALARLCGLDEVDIVLSDPGLSADHQAQVRAAGCELILA